MKRFALLLTLFTLACADAAAKQSLPPDIQELVAPSVAAGASGAALWTAPDRTIWLTWVEPSAAGADAPRALRVATFDPAAQKWRAPHTIATGAGLTASQADFPRLAVNAAGAALAIWTDGKGGAFRSESFDQGATWSAPRTFTRESDEAEKFAITVLADDRFLVAWLDGRGKKSGGKVEQLFARPVSIKPGAAAEKDAPDQLVDSSVCDCCQNTLTPFLDGGALLAYRGRTDEEVRDIRTARFDGKGWSDPRPLNADDWHINACPINGPSLASDGGRVGVAWFTGADNDPRVLASYSPNAGEQFLMPLRLDTGVKPAGHVDMLILHDGALLGTWLDAEGGFWLRRVTPDFVTDEPAPLVAAAQHVMGFPRTALVRDYAGGETPAQFLTAYVAGKPATLHTQLITVREGELLSDAKDCACAPTPEQLSGFPMRGAVTKVAADQGSVNVMHPDIPGVLRSGNHDFKAAANVLSALQPGRRFLGRIEKRQGKWWLFDVRPLVGSGSP